MTHADFTIRPFTPDDQDAAKRLINEGLGERFGSLDESANPDLDDIAAYYSARGHMFIIARRDNELIGTGCLMMEPDGATGQMVRVSVRRDLRGQGIGRALVAHLLDVARVSGLRRVWMETNVGWESAIRLYEACGFREYDRADGLVFLESEIEAQDRHANTEARDTGEE